ncbi:glycosyl transferase [Psychrobacter okhotskensis]|uniref:ATP-grasp fold amidoligase family protein n=1 Tax=Psychrobacter okhotskensis TaxID=212403 RepID=UPI0015676865|nr:ATP-grasp fold amidoligase family protein [Psychrobacter okhotskensis]NRD69956.1 glycosyl transferase [Psychrobacter okhotskensis]
MFLKLIKKRDRAAVKLLYTLSPVIPNKIYLKVLFRLKTGYSLNLKTPRTFNEKLQWLKLNYYDENLPQRVDKQGYKEWAKGIVGEQYLPETYSVWDTFEQIEWSKLPDQFVLKTTHDQGGVVICKNKKEFDFEAAQKKLNKHLKSNLYYRFREWPYKYVKPRIMAEELLVDSEKGDLWDFKFYCFNGVPKVMYISLGRSSEHTPFYFFDMNFKKLDIIRPGHEPYGDIIEKPLAWELMKELAGKLSTDQPHVRIDFYCIEEKIFIGEYTLFQGGGMMPFKPKDWDFKLGDFINLPLDL